MQTQIKALLLQGVPIRKVALSLGISRQTVRKFLSEAPKAAADIAEDVPPPEQETKPWHEVLDWKPIIDALHKGTTVKQLHLEYAPGVKYWSFWKHLRCVLPKKTPAITMRLSHVPGERVEIDYADGISLVDRQTGETQKTYLFCAVLPFSAYSFGEFVMDQKLPSFLASHERMWSFFGGVTPYAVVDNLKSGVLRAHRYDPDVNPTYCEYSTHAGFAVLPARPYKPRDKASVEAGIGSVQRGFFQEVRERKFYSLAELNDAFREYLHRFNHGIMKDHGVSRAARFETESPLLKALPETRFELTETRFAKVHPDCHIQVGKNFYSVPYHAVGKRVRVRLGSKLVEIFDEDNSVLAAHLRSLSKGHVSTDPRHYPEQKVGVVRFEVAYAQEQARRIGPHTEALIAALVSGEYPLRHLRRIQGILRLESAKHVTAAALEYACRQATLFRKPRVQFIKDCAKYFETHGQRLRLVVPERNKDHVYLHGTVAHSDNATRGNNS